MKNVIIIREFRKETDTIACADLLRTSIMSHIPAAFFMFLFKEITLEIMVLVAAIFFIFFGLPIYLCASTIPCVALIVYLITYGTHSYKASEVAMIQPKRCWVAEASEPYFMNCEPKQVKYGVFYEEDYKSDEIETNAMCKKIVGMVSVRHCYGYTGPSNSLWLYGLAVDKKYQRKGVGKMLVGKAIEFTRGREYDSLELLTTDLQNEARLLFQEEKFQLKQIYHRRICISASLGKYHMGMLTREQK